MAKGSKLSRMVQFFEEADIHEAQYVVGRALEIMKRRLDFTANAAGKPARKKRQRKDPVQDLGNVQGSVNRNAAHSGV